MLVDMNAVKEKRELVKTGAAKIIASPVSEQPRPFIHTVCSVP